MNLDKKEHVHKICLELLKAVKNQENVEQEVFNILIHLSPYIGHLIPLQSDFSSFDDLSLLSEKEEESHDKFHLKHFKYVIEKLEVYYVSKVKEVFQFNMKLNKDGYFSNSKDFKITTFQLGVVCSSISKLQVIIGNKQVEEKFLSIIARCMDFLLQQHDLYDNNAYKNLERLTKQFTSLFLYVKELIKNVIYILTCAQVFKHRCEKLAFVQETILEKLSIQLLTLSDSVKSSFLKTTIKSKLSKSNVTTNNKQKEKFQSSSCENKYLSSEALVNFATIINEFLSLESFLENLNALNISESKNSNTRKGVLKHQSLELPDLIKTSHHSSLLYSSSKYRRWDWCETLQEFAPILGDSMTSSLQNTCCKLLSEEKERYRLNSVSSLKYVSSAYKQISNIFTKAPKTCFIFIKRLLDLILKLSPLSIIGGKHRFLSKLKSDFIDAINQVFKEIKPFLTDLIEDTPEKNCPSNLSVLLASCQDIVLILQFCDQKLNHDHRLSFQGTIQMYKSICNHLEQFITQYQKSRLSTVILHDAESNYWSDPRSFAGDDHCSYPVEMWQPFMLKIHLELFQTVNEQSFQKIVSEIFCDSLCILVNRYCNCIPSYNRYNQVKKDIVEILKFSYLFLLKIQNNPHDMCTTQSITSCYSNNITFNKIQVACKDLFTCLNILATPLDCFYDILSLLATYQLQKSPPCSWLSFIDFTLFPVDWNGECSNLTDTAFVCCILNEMQGESEKNLILAIKALAACNGFLLNKIVKEKKELQSLKQALCNSLLLVNLFQEAISWKIFIKSELHSLAETDFAFTDFTFFSKSHEDCLTWQNVLREKLASGIENALLPAINCLSHYCLSSFGKSLCKRFPSEISSSIPGIFNDDADEIVYICTCLLFQGLHSHALSLPDFVVTMLVQIDELIDESSKSAFYFGSYGAHALLHLASLYISDTRYIKKIFCSDLSSTATAALTEVAKFSLQIGNELQISNLEEESREETWKIMMNELSAYKECTCMLFSHLENQEMVEIPFDCSKLVLALENKSISYEAMVVWTDFSQLLAKNKNSLIFQLLGVEKIYFSKGK